MSWRLWSTIWRVQWTNITVGADLWAALSYGNNISRLWKRYVKWRLPFKSKAWVVSNFYPGMHNWHDYITLATWRRNARKTPDGSSGRTDQRNFTPVEWLQRPRKLRRGIWSHGVSCGWAACLEAVNQISLHPTTGQAVVPTVHKSSGTCRLGTDISFPPQVCYCVLCFSSSDSAVFIFSNGAQEIRSERGIRRNLIPLQILSVSILEIIRSSMCYISGCSGVRNRVYQEWFGSRWESRWTVLIHVCSSPHPDSPSDFSQVFLPLNHKLSLLQLISPRVLDGPFICWPTVTWQLFTVSTLHTKFTLVTGDIMMILIIFGHATITQSWILTYTSDDVHFDCHMVMSDAPFSFYYQNWVAPYILAALEYHPHPDLKYFCCFSYVLYTMMSVNISTRNKVVSESHNHKTEFLLKSFIVSEGLKDCDGDGCYSPVFWGKRSYFGQKTW